MVKCPRCGYENSATSVYCDNCAFRLTDQNGNRLTYNQRKKGWSMGIVKKIVIVLGIVVIALLLFSFIYNSSQPTPEDSLNVITDDGSNPHSSSYPYRAVIIYEGSWYAKMGDPNYMADQSGTGNANFVIDCASWERVAIEAQKEDYGEGTLTIQLLKDGKVVAENSTTDTNGGVAIYYNY